MMSEIKEIPSLQVSLCSMIRSFFEKLNADQELLLLSRTLDETTRPLLLELISNIINNLSSAVQTRVTEMDVEVTEELVVSSLGNAVTESFKAALDFKYPGQSRSGETLRDLISQEVMVSVQCSMSDTPKEHVTSPKTLKRMLKLTTRMIRAIKKKMSTACTEEVLEPEDDSVLPFLLLPDYKPEESKKSSQPTRRPYRKYKRVDNYYEDEDEGDVVSITFEDDCCCWWEALLYMEEISEDYVKPEPFLRGDYQPEDSVMPTERGEESGSSPASDGGSPLQLIFLSDPSEEDVVPSLGASPDASEEALRKHTVLLIIEKLMSLTYRRNKVEHYMTDPESILERLMARTWAAVEDVNLDYSPKTYANLEKTIFKDLVKKWGCESSVLVHMKVGTPALEEFVANAIKDRLTAPPEKPGSLRRWAEPWGLCRV